MVTVRVAELADTTLLDALNRLLPQLSSTARSLEMADLEAILSASTTTLLVATEGAAVIGALTLVEFVIPTGRRAWIEDVIVDEAARGRGVGEALTVAAIAQARRRGVRTIELTSRPSREAANALYQKLGFERRETNVYRFFLESEDPER